MEQFHIAEYDEVVAKLEEVKDMANFLPDVTSEEGYEKSKRVSLDIGKILTTLEKKRVEKKAFFLEGGRQVDKQAKAIAEKLESFQLPHKQAYKELDEIKKKLEEDRKAALVARLEKIKGLHESVLNLDSAAVKIALESIKEEQCLEFFEYTEQAVNAKKKAIDDLTALYESKFKQEEQEKELARLKQEQIEREQKEREEKIARDAAAKAEKEKAEAEAREAQAKKDAEEAAKRAKEAELKLEQQKKEAAQAAIKAKEEAEKQRKLAEEKAKKDAEESARIARENEIKRQQQEKEKEAAELAKREANKKYISEIRTQAKEDLIKLGLSEDLAKSVILAVHDNKVRNIKINY